MDGSKARYLLHVLVEPIFELPALPPVLRPVVSRLLDYYGDPAEALPKRGIAADGVEFAVTSAVEALPRNGCFATPSDALGTAVPTMATTEAQTSGQLQDARDDAALAPPAPPRLVLRRRRGGAVDASAVGAGLPGVCLERFIACCGYALISKQSVSQ